VALCALALPLTLVLPDAKSNPRLGLLWLALVISAWRGGWRCATLASVLVLIEEALLGFPPSLTLLASPLLVVRVATLITVVIVSAIVFSHLGTFVRRVRELLVQEREARKAAELASATAREGEAKFRSLFENSLDAILLTTPEGAITAANPAACAVFGMSEEELCQAERDRLVDPDDARHAAFLEQCMRAGKVSGELSYVRKDGTKFIAEVSSVILGGPPPLSVIVLRDITERKAVEVALREAARFNQQILDSARDGIIVFDSDLRFRVWNRFMEELTAIAAKDILGRSLLELFPFLQGTGVIEKIQNVLSNGVSEVLEFPYLLAKYGHIGWTSSVGGPLRNEAGEIIGVISIVRDISERKLAEERLRESEARFRVLFDSAPISLWEGDSSGIKTYLDGLVKKGVVNFEDYLDAHPEDVYQCMKQVRILDVSQATVSLFEARDKAELLGNWNDVLTPESIQVFKRTFLAMYRGQKVLQDEIVLRTLKGRPLTAHVDVTLVPGFESSWTTVLISVVDLTARKQAEEELRARENLLHLFIDHAPAALAMFDREMHYLYASHRWLKDYNLGDRDLRGMSHYDVFPEITVVGREACRRGLAGEIVRAESDRFERADGSVQWIRREVRPWRDAAGEVGGIVIFTEDITERHLAEEALRSNEAKMQGIVSSAMDAIISVDEQQRIVVFNQAAEKIFQCTASDALGSSLDRFIPSRYGEAHRGYIRRFAEASLTSCSARAPDALTAIRNNGEEFPIEIAVSQIQAGKEKIYTAILRDISRRKRAEDGLRASEERLRLLGDNLPNSMVYQYTHEPDGRPRFLYVSAGIERLNGLKAEDVLKDADVFHRQLLPGELPALLEAERVSARDLSVFEREVQMLLPNGQLRWMHLRSRPRSLPDGRVIWDGVQTDITERKRAEHELRRSEEQLRALAARVQSVAEEERLRISRELHDQLGQALTAIKMDLDWLARKRAAPGEAQEEQIRGTMELVDSTIGLVRKLSAELRPAVLDTFGLSAALELQAEEFQRRTGIQCSVQAAPGRVGLSAEQRIAVFRICQEVLTNIVRHAGASRVDVTLAGTGGHVVFAVQDDGKGFNVESLDNRHSLGILGMQERAFMVGGVLDVNSAPGAGTRITLRIPLKFGKIGAEQK
jgi:PAS domain S-box-containing protein